MKKTLLITLLAPFFACANSSNGFNDIVSINIHDSGNLLIELSSSQNTEGCSTPGLNNTILISKNNPNFKMMHAQALLALATGRQIGAWVSGCTDLWGNGSKFIATATTMTIKN